MDERICLISQMSSGGILNKENCLTIMKNYSELENIFFNEAGDECTECGYNENECTC